MTALYKSALNRTHAGTNHVRLLFAINIIFDILQSGSLYPMFIL